jgi:hypothetical protein
MLSECPSGASNIVQKVDPFSFSILRAFASLRLECPTRGSNLFRQLTTLWPLISGKRGSFLMSVSLLAGYLDQNLEISVSTQAGFQLTPEAQAPQIRQQSHVCCEKLFNIPWMS